VPINKILKLGLVTQHIGFRVHRSDRKRVQHIILNSHATEYLLQLALHHLTGIISTPEEKAYRVRPSAYRLKLKAIGSIWRQGGLARAGLILGSIVILALILPCLLCCGSAMIGQSTDLTPTQTPTTSPRPTLTSVPFSNLTDTPRPTRTSTPRPEPTATPDCTLAAAYEADVTVPDNTEIEIGRKFVKTWRVRNTGTCDWGSGYEWTFVDGERMGALTAVIVPMTPAGQSVEISVEMTAPRTEGTYRGYWQMCISDGTCFGDRLYIQIITFDPSRPTATPVPPPPPTSPPAPHPPAAVCDCSGNIYNCANFVTHAEAQACYNYCISVGRGDIHRLDGDNDGSACESLP
jgi:hypothetical protein